MSVGFWDTGEEAYSLQMCVRKLVLICNTFQFGAIRLVTPRSASNLGGLVRYIEPKP